tara:strand:- start:385 stop:1341 length:957 start_codon:yes stop_codon:yes gene_type:complete
MKLLMENWRKFINEQEGSKLDAVANALASPNTSLAQYVAVLKRYAGDPSFEKLATAGQADGEPKDEQVKVQRTATAAAKLTATQAEIGFDNSLKDQMTNPQYNPPPVNAALGLAGTPIIMPSQDDPPPPILVYNGKFILDGHHRWSQIMMMNPTGVVAIDNVTGPALDDEEEALKAMQMAIAVAADNVKTKPFKGQNLMGASEQEVMQYVVSNITDDVLNLLVKAEKIEQPDKKLAAAYVAGNLKVIKSRQGKFSREKSMPQAGASGTSQDTVNSLLGTGKVNFEVPKASDIKGAGKLGSAGMRGGKSGFAGALKEDK